MRGALVYNIMAGVSGKLHDGFDLAAMNPKTAQGREKLGSLLIYAALIAETIIMLIDMSEIPYGSMSLIFRGTFAISFLALCLKHHEKKVWAGLAVMMLFGVFCWYHTGRNEILRFFVFAAACGGEDVKKLLKTEFFMGLAGSLLIVLLSLTGLFGAVDQTTHYRMGQDETTRNTLGFGHPNALHCMFLMLLILGMAIWYESMRLKQFVAVCVACIVMFLITDSRTGAVASFFAVAFAAAVKLITAFRDRLAATGSAPAKCFAEGLVDLCYTETAAIVMAGCVFTVWAAKWSTHSRVWWYVYESVDRFLNGRMGELEFGALEKASLAYWSLFSRRGAGRYFDMGIARLYYWYGIIPATMAVFIVLLTIALCRRYNEKGFLVMIAAMALYTVFEAHLVSVFIGRNYLLPVMGVLFSRYLAEGRDKT